MFLLEERRTDNKFETLVNSTIHGFMEKCVNAYRWKERVRGFPQNVDIVHDREVSFFTS